MSLDPKLPLNFDTFFPYLINHPEDATEDDRPWTWAASIILGIFTVGVVHLSCALYERFSKNAEVKTEDNLSEKERRVDKQGQEVLGTASKKSKEELEIGKGEKNVSAIETTGEADQEGKPLPVSTSPTIPIPTPASIPNVITPVTPPKPIATIKADSEVYANAKAFVNTIESSNKITSQQAFYDLFGEKWKDKAKLAQLQQLGNEPEGLELLSILSTYFTRVHWSALSDEQILVDPVRFVSADEKRNEDILRFLFPFEKGDQRLATLFDHNREGFYAISGNLWRSHWDRLASLGTERVRAFDFSKIPNEKGRERASHSYAKILPTFGAGEEGLKKIRELKECLGVNGSDKYLEWWEDLSDEQGVAVSRDFLNMTEGFDEGQRKKIFNALCGAWDPYTKGDRIHRLAMLGTDEKGLEALYLFTLYFSNIKPSGNFIRTEYEMKKDLAYYQWKALSFEQLLAADFSRLIPSTVEKQDREKLMNLFFPVPADNKNNTQERMQQFFEKNRESFYAIHQDLWFAHLKYLKDSQVIEIDYSRLSKDPNRVERYSSLSFQALPTLGMNDSVKKKIFELKGYFGVSLKEDSKNNWWEALSEEQAFFIATHFEEMTEGFNEAEKKQVFNLLFGRDAPNLHQQTKEQLKEKAKVLGYLGPDEKGLEALYQLIPYFSNNIEGQHWNAITQTQALAMDLSKIDPDHHRKTLIELFWKKREHVEALSDTRVVEIAERFQAMRTDLSSETFGSFIAFFKKNRSPEVVTQLNEIFNR